MSQGQANWLQLLLRGRMPFEIMIEKITSKNFCYRCWLSYQPCSDRYVVNSSHRIPSKLIIFVCVNIKCYQGKVGTLRVLKGKLKFQTETNFSSIPIARRHRMILLATTRNLFLAIAFASLASILNQKSA